ncbi:RHS repeat-associated core domain-containing protein [Pseudomonas wayambapalatensis]|uniref:RHS repeat-associated core domain-containing protein n=1 Tax=Pseudomonas wayambapalatensis TaxID=485895 RepID=UPI003CF25C14
MSSALFQQTPSIKVLDNRGQTVREIEYQRASLLDAADTRITRQVFSPAGRLAQITDPRLHGAGLANFIHRHDLTAQVIRTQSVDAGVSLDLKDAARRDLFSVSRIGRTLDGQGNFAEAVTRTLRYEPVDLPGRLLAVSEQVAGDTPRTRERVLYGGNEPQEKALNLAGTRIVHYDPAGCVSTLANALGGAALCVQRKLLKGGDDDAVQVNWQGEAAEAWDALLDDQRYTTRSHVDATGKGLTALDCAGHQQRSAYDVAGVLAASWLTLEGTPEREIVRSASYSAGGRKQHEVHGNGIVTVYTYEPTTLRLATVRTTRQTSEGQRLQDLHYRYDPVGNVVGLANDAEPTRFWRNQKISAQSEYRYDSLYQLVFASGREMANAGQQGNHLPGVLVPLPVDDSAYTLYTRSYTYDSAGNLTHVRHSAPATNNNYVTAITVSQRSNRGVSSVLASDPAKVEVLFSAGGEQRVLLPGQPLEWTARGELRRVAGGTQESYRYDAGRQRVLKVSHQQQGGSLKVQRTLYLPGLELRITTVDGAVRESLHMVVMGEAGRAQVRALRWEAGKPEGIDNDQVRFGYDNLIGSVGLELNGEGSVISLEEYYPYGGTAILAGRHRIEVEYKTVRYSGRERDVTGLYYYGYRYYQPWVGRWLNPDPAGTVDGINIFRMTRNNPIMFRDVAGLMTNEGGIEFGGGVSSNKFELNFGLRSYRDQYLKNTIGINWEFGPYGFSIDQYNLAVATTIKDLALAKDSGDHGHKFTGRELSKKIRPEHSMLDAAASRYPGYSLWPEYIAVLKKHPRFDILNVYTEVRLGWGKEDFHTWLDAHSGPQLLWKRGSKAGIELVASHDSATLHFILDGIDLDAVIDKTRGAGRSVTSSELRYVKRNWPRLETKTLFSLGGRPVPAPWISNKDAWRRYTPKSIAHQPASASSRKSR